MILTLCAFVLLGLLDPYQVSAIPSPDVLGPIIQLVVFLFGFVSLGFGILSRWLMGAARFLTPKDRRRSWMMLIGVFLFLLLCIAGWGLDKYWHVRTVIQTSFRSPPSQGTSTFSANTTTFQIVEPPPLNNLLSARVASSTLLVPTSLLKEVIAQPGWDHQILLLDIREQEEREVGVVDASTTWMRYGDLIHGGVDTLPRDRDILVICWTSMRGSETVRWLRDHGVDRSFAIKGGLQGVREKDKHGWIPDGLPWKGKTNWSTAFDIFEYPKRASLDTAKSLYDDGATVFDVREPEFFGEGHIVNAYSLPLQMAPTTLVSSTFAHLTSSSTPILVYADGYINTFYAQVLGLRLLRLGFSHTVLVIDKEHAWKTRGYPFTPSLVMQEGER